MTAPNVPERYFAVCLSAAFALPINKKKKKQTLPEGKFDENGQSSGSRALIPISASLEDLTDVI